MNCNENDNKEYNKDSFLCSVCIPTYNRADMLKKTLQAFIDTDSFRKGKVELVISDNASEDNTYEICKCFQQEHPDKIQYLRHEKGIDPHLNFKFSLDHGRGKYLKLNNDHVYFLQNEFDNFISILEKNQEQYDFVFFTGYDKNNETFVSLETLDALIQSISYFITSINLLCIRKDIYKFVQDPFRAWKSCLPQTDLCLRLFASGSKGLLTPHLKFHEQQIIYGTNRNEAKIFGRNYIGMLHSYYKEKKISRKIYQREKRRVLVNHIFVFHFDFFHQYTAHQKIPPFWRYMGYYKKDLFFYAVLVWIAFYYFTTNIIPIHQMLGKIKRGLLKN